MIYEQLNDKISEAMKLHDNEKVNTMRLIKTELTNFIKTGKKLTENDEINILIKMISQRKDSINEYKKGNREDLITKEETEIKIINEFLPELPSEEDIEEYTKNVIKEYIEQNDSDYKLTMKDMKPILIQVQKKYSTANGKIVSNILKQYI